MRKESLVMRALFWCLAAVIAVRIALPRLFGLLDNDSIVLFLDARNQVDNHVWSMVSTLQVHFISFFYRLLDEQLYAARWVSVLAGLGVMLVLHEAAGRGRAGRLTALVFAVVPISIFFGTSALPYGTLAFLGLLGLWLLAEAIDGRGIGLAALAGLALAGAFLCKTFAAVLVLPAGVALAAALVDASARRQLRYLPPLVTLVVWTAVIGAVVAWRQPVFGASVFNDYPTDWRFDLAAAVWQGRWVGLVNLHAVGLPLLLPGVVAAWGRGRGSTFARLAVWYGAAIVVVYLFNPVNHFPRVLYALAPVLAFFAGRGIERAVVTRRLALLAVWAVLAWAMAAAYWLWPAWWLDGRTWPVILLAAAATGLAALAARAPLAASARVVDGVAAALIVGLTVFGLRAGYGDLDRVERAFVAQVEAVRHAEASSGIVGGGDSVHLVLGGGNNYSTFLDLPPERLEQLLRDGLPVMLRSLRAPIAVADVADAGGILRMLAPLAAQLEIDPQTLADPFAALEADPHSARLLDNGRFVLYRLDDVYGDLDETWPEWSRVQPRWDRTGLGVVHPTPARLAVRKRPVAAAPPGTVDRTVVVELTDVPGGENTYRVTVNALDGDGKVLWTRSSEEITDHDVESPGVQLVQLTITRRGADVPDALVIPSRVKGVRRVEVTAEPVGTGHLLRVLVPVPGWW